MNSNVWRRTTVILLILVPVLFAANVVQSFRFSAVERQIERDRSAIDAAIELNKRLIAGIAGLQSPARIRTVATEQLAMRPVAPGMIIHLSVGSGDDER